MSKFLTGTERGSRWMRLASSLMARFTRSSRSGSESVLQIEEKLSLGPKKMLYLVRCRQKEFLVAAGADTIVSMLEVLAEAPQRKAAVQSVRRGEKVS